jgi:hypothetical protein
MGMGALRRKAKAVAVQLRGAGPLLIAVALVAVVGLAGCEEAASPASPGLTSAGDASLTADSASIDASADSAASQGIGKSCVVPSDCASVSLTCFETNASTGAGICSKLCSGSLDCPQGSYCNPQSGKLICTEPRFCNPCQVAADCGKGGLCLQGAGGMKYCTKACAQAKASCPAASSCRQYGSNVDDFACQPDYGSCAGDGNQCSPCTGQGDCASGLECHLSASTGERFCAKTCSPGAANACPSGYGCATPKGSKTSYCFKSVGSELIATCAKGDKGFCEPCNADYECASARCASKNGEKYCVAPTPCTGPKDCPYGGEATFCVPSDNGKGMICAPPLSWGCQGYLTCLAHACASDEICVAGQCKEE